MILQCIMWYLETYLMTVTYSVILVMKFILFLVFISFFINHFYFYIILVLT